MVEKLPIMAALAVGTLNAYSSTQSLDGAWEFSRDGGTFKKVTVPHDWAIAGPFDPSAPCRSGKLPWQGYGEIVAVGNGDPRSYKSFKDVSSHPLYYGKCVVVVSRKASSTEPVVLTAAVPGLESASVVFGCGKEP